MGERYKIGKHNNGPDGATEKGLCAPILERLSEHLYDDLDLFFHYGAVCKRRRNSELGNVRNVVS